MHQYLTAQMFQWIIKQIWTLKLYFTWNQTHGCKDINVNIYIYIFFLNINVLTHIRITYYTAEIGLHLLF